ncbi:MAG: class I SAM-dependent methyltransferase [Nitrospirota bacterium]|nr:MAG: class I SAM-dependent methyltransferase [Nitrospirota bacterium]
MPTIGWNKKVWDSEYNWDAGGDEWSGTWGGSDMHWYGSILPRIHCFLPAATILEIGPGYGRWSQYLKENCDNLIVLDISDKCIQACKERFKSSSNIQYIVNDGSSLDMILDGSVDFIFSFDSLVHAEDDVMSGYIDQFSRILKEDGAGFIHHSNLGEYRRYFSLLRWLLSKLSLSTEREGSGRSINDDGSGISGTLQKIAFSLAGNMIIDRSHLRALSMTADKFNRYAEDAGLQCVGQEIINWGSKRLIDCFSTFTVKGSRWQRDNILVRNGAYMKEAGSILNASRLYSSSSFK